MHSVCVQNELEKLGAQRAGLEDMLKEMKRKVKLSQLYKIDLLWTGNSSGGLMLLYFNSSIIHSILAQWTKMLK